MNLEYANPVVIIVPKKYSKYYTHLIYYFLLHCLVLRIIPFKINYFKVVLLCYNTVMQMISIEWFFLS